MVSCSNKCGSGSDGTSDALGYFSGQGHLLYASLLDGL